MTETDKRIIEAYERGYRVSEDGVLTGPKGILKVKLYGKQRYPTFSTNWGGYVYGVPTHQFAAYCFYGDVLFDVNLVVRHLDANTINIAKTNIVMGTYSQNEHDKCPKARSRVGVIARSAQSAIPCNRKLSKDDVFEVLTALELLGTPAPKGSNKSLCESYGVSRTTLNKLQKGKIYPELYQEWLSKENND